jgi:putative PIN family toxin of toxin-antitoxin system
VSLKTRYILDTNVVVSGLLFNNSKPAIALQYTFQHGEFLLSLELLEEIAEVLSRDKFKRYITNDEREEFLETLLERANLIEVVDTVEECRDPKDNHILELALSGETNIIVTGDKDLLVMNPFRNIEIMSVEQFLVILELS